MEKSILVLFFQNDQKRRYTRLCRMRVHRWKYVGMYVCVGVWLCMYVHAPEWTSSCEQPIDCLVVI